MLWSTESKTLAKSKYRISVWMFLSKFPHDGMEDGQELCDTMISNEAVLFIRDEARDMVVEIVAYATLTCLAYVGQQ